MSSTNKTENYSLNQWVLNDVPKMEDFNSDNKTIDTVMFKHISDSVIHLSEEEKQAVVNPLEMYTYHGDGTANRDIDLPFTFEPSLCIVFVVGAPLGIIDISNQVHYNYFGIASKGGSSVGLSLKEKVLSVVQSTAFCTLCKNPPHRTYFHGRLRQERSYPTPLHEKQARRGGRRRPAS